MKKTSRDPLRRVSGVLADASLDVLGEGQGGSLAIMHGCSRVTRAGRDLVGLGRNSGGIDWHDSLDVEPPLDRFNHLKTKQIRRSQQRSHSVAEGRY